MITSHPYERPLSLSETAALLRVGESTVRRYVKTGLLPATRLARSGRYRIARQDVDRLLHPVEAERM